MKKKNEKKREKEGEEQEEERFVSHQLRKWLLL